MAAPVVHSPMAVGAGDIASGEHGPPGAVQSDSSAGGRGDPKAGPSVSGLLEHKVHGGDWKAVKI